MSPKEQFDVIALVPASAGSATAAAAAASAGGVGVLDLEFSRDAERVANNFKALLDASTGRIGLRISARSLDVAKPLLALADDRPLTLIYAGTVAEQTQTAAKLKPGKTHLVLAELTDADMPAQLKFAHAGYVAKGHEAGGWVGADTSYILAQKLLGKLDKPVFVQGGIGVNTAAGLRALGAAGVVLDDQLLLLTESPLSATAQNELSRLNGAETRLYGELIDQPCRIYSRPGNPALKVADEDLRLTETGEMAQSAWRDKLDTMLGWDGGELLLPVGQGIGVAARYRDRYRSVGRLIAAVRKASLKHIETAAKLDFLAPGAPLAKSHGTQYPLCQGPMTRVSDHAGFAYEVSKNGALPFLALALMRGPQVLEMLEETKALMKRPDGTELPWGVGMLGFVPHSLREEQIAAVWKCKPTFALIAGGRPDQAAHFEKEGIPTYIHAPAPALLKMYIEQGAKRFVFEGRECGGHIGPIASFPLWEQMIETLLDNVPAGSEGDYHVLFAGGIHDARSGAMLEALTAPLAARGLKVGALMGTAYLFTKEIVDSGAIVEGFRNAAISCDKTVNFETGPGHATRCVDTPFFREFREARLQLLREGVSADELRDRLEDMNMGRMRVASKGLNRDASGKIVQVSVEDQYKDGMFMIGQIATMRDKVQTCADLHADVCSGGSAMIKALVDKREERVAAAKPADIAIVGMGTLLPKADEALKYWENIIDQVNVLGEVPKTRWDWELYFNGDRRARDKVYSRWGGFLDEIPFDPISYGIPPKSMRSIDPMQLLTLEVTRRALNDAGYADGDFDRDNTSVILGAGGGLGDLGTQYAVRSELPRFVENLSEEVWERLPEWTEESFAGTLLNVAAGRVANRMDFGGLNFTVDAACGSSLAAITIAVNELEAGRSNIAIAGGIDTVQSPFGFMCFSKTQALSPTGKPKTFDTGADGIAISEGLAVVVLKRLADAERDGDRIYAVIKAAAGSSDGKALGMTAPRPEGQMRALTRAYGRAGFSPTTLGMFEAHGTGTAVGDKAEAKTITQTLISEGALPRSAAIGSVKTLLGHTKASAGVAGMIKVALSLYYRTLPAHAGVSAPIEPIADANSPVYLLKDAKPWFAPGDVPRRGGCSAFGFGGTNFHVVLEEYRAGGTVAPGAERWPHELFVVRANDDAALLAETGRLATALRQGTRLKLRDIAYSLARQAESRPNAKVTLAIVAKDYAGLIADLEAVATHLQSGKPLPPSVRLGRGAALDASKVAFLFPGQGSQYVNMGRESALYVEELRGALELADATLRSDFPRGLTRLMMPHAAFTPDEEAAQTKALTDTRVAQPAIGALSLGYLRLAERLGLAASAAAGHSYGEYSALCAAGVLAPRDFLKLSAVRGQCMADAAGKAAPGAMAAIQASRDKVEATLAALGEAAAGVKVANHNAPEQAVISGPAAGVEAAAKRMEADGLRVTRLAVSGAFHTELVAAAQDGLSQAIKDTAFGNPSLTVYSNTTGKPYPAKAAAMRKQLDGHLLNSVEFVAEIEAMYAAGARLFVELGPKGVCANMAKATLAGRDAIAVSLDGQGGGLRGLLLGLAEVSAAGVALQWSRLFDARDAQLVDLNKLAELVKPLPLAKHVWWLSGGNVRPLDDPQMRTGSLPPLNSKTAPEKREAYEKAIMAKAPTPPPQIVHVPVAGPAAPAAAAAPAASLAPPAGSAMATDALLAYQNTMRQFLSLQERVIQQFLGAAAAPMPGLPAMPAMPAAAPVAMPAPLPMPAAPVMPVAAPVAAPVVVAAPVAAPVVAPVAAPVVAAPVAAAPAVSVAVSTPAAPAITRASLQDQLLAIVSDRTGYPTEMLGLEQDLEAELGIDSIKRVEILGALQKALPGDASAAMQGGMEKFTRARSLTQILDAAMAVVPASATMAAPAVAVSVAVAAPAATAAPAISRASLQDQLLAIVSDRTGYPTDMLGLDQDLEAELGIDSIKRVEILGALQKSLPGDASAAMQGGMEKFTRARSLTQILDAAMAIVPATAAVAAPMATVAVSAPVAAVAAAPSVDRGSLQSQLLAIVSDRTGYPTDMLGLDQDLEAELGIDSIKRVEILGALQKSLPGDASAAMQGGMEKFTRARSLNAILDAAMAIVPASAAPVAVAAAAPVSVAVAVAAPATPSINRGTLQSQLLTIVSDRTGYPTDMLGLDQDLEAELGIDSIKRVEILGELQKSLPGEASSAMQGGMEKFTRARSLNAILDAAMALAPAAAAPVAVAAAAPVSVAVAVAAPAAPAINRGTLQTQLLTIVADRTGYPTDMLGLDQDLEAELGIDSIKRVEILGELQKSLPGEASAAMQGGMEKFTRARSLNAILDAAMALAATPAATVAVTAAPAAVPAAAPVVNTRRTPRYVPRSRPAPLPAKRHTLEGLHLITAGKTEVAQALAKRVNEAGARAVIVDAASVANPAAIAATVAKLRAEHGAVRGIVHLAGLDTTAAMSLDAWLAAAQLQVKSLFFLMQAAGADLSAKDSVVLSASSLGGTLGRDAEGSSLAVAGGAVGLFNCAVAEWATLRARLVDFESGAEAEAIAGHLFNEMTVADTRTEVGYVGTNGHTTRIGFVHEAETVKDHPFAPHLEPAGDWVMLITGGARGITAEIAEELVKPGMRLVLVGRTPTPGAESPATASLSDAAQIKKALLQAAMAAGRQPKPVELDREYKALMADREIRANLQRLTKAGATVDYRACDVRDAAALGALVDSVYADYGRIDAVLHGAGVIEDKRIADKTPESFDRVYDTKVGSAWTLTQKLKADSLKLMAFFTSVAGRFGNVGQGDYGAANETLNRYAWQLHRQWPRVRVIAINWGPWESGMATEAIQAGFRAQGIEPIPLAGGRRYFREELAFGPPKDVELIAGEGPWKYQAAQVPAPVAVAPVAAAAPAAANARWPLIRTELGMGAGGGVQLQHTLGLANDLYLSDHRMDGKAVLPAAGALEYIAEFVAAGYPEWKIAEVRDLKALQGIVLEGDKDRELVFKARSSTHSEAGTQAVTVELVDPARKLACYRATVVLAEMYATPPAAPAELSGERVDGRSAYAKYLFHGKRFQLISEVTAVTPEGLDAIVTPSTPQGFLAAAGAGAQWVFDPGLVDTAPQLAIVWARINRGMTPLPSRFGVVTRYGNEPLTGPLRLSLRVKPAPHANALVYDVHVMDTSGRVRLTITDAEGTMSEALNRLVGNS